MSDNSADRNKQGRLHPYKTSVLFGRGARQPLEGQLEAERKQRPWSAVPTHTA